MPRRPYFPDCLHDRPFTRAEAVALGVSERVLSGPLVLPVHHGVYLAAGLDLTLELRVDAVLLVLPPSAIASHDTAARLQGLPVPRPHDGELHFWVPSTYTGRRPRGVTLHRYRVRPSTAVTGGRTVTTPGKTFIDMATRLGLVDLVALGDAIVNRIGVLPLELQKLAREPRRRWIKKARQAARLVRAGVDSPPETHLRLAILDEFLPEPLTGMDVFDDAGGWIARPDLSWPQWKVAVEYDGEHHLRDERQWNRDIGRRETLEREGWVVVVVTADRLYRRRRQTIALIEEALRRQGAPIF